MLKYLFPVYLWLNIALTLAIIPWLFMADNPGTVLLILMFLLVTLLPAAYVLVVRDHRRKKRFLRPLAKELKRHGKQSKKDFLANFPSEQHLLANLLRNAFAGHVLVSPKYLHHDTPITDLPLVHAFETACHHSQYLGTFSLRLETEKAWWNRSLEHLQKKDDTIKGLVQFFTNLENRLGEVLADVELPTTQKGVGGEGEEGNGV